MKPSHAAIITAAREQPGTVAELARRTHYTPDTVRDAIERNGELFRVVGYQRRRQPGQPRKVWGVSC